ncbi:MAG: M1 family metallopeptidase [Cuniculiplasma sp.]
MKEISSYNIYYEIDVEKFIFRGHEKISGESGDSIWLNCSGIVIESFKVNGKEEPFEINGKEQIVKALNPHSGKFELEIYFSGKIDESLNGIYYSKEKDFIFVSTQFEATGARYAFPCMDNPDFKAEFTVTLDIPSDYDGISNMPPETIEGRQGRTIITFQNTPRMSTYLLYLGVSRYDVVEGRHEEKPVYLVSARGKFKASQIPIKMASDTLSYFEDYFNIKYQLPKLHLIAVPEFAFGAMENWGAITFREIELMVNDSTSSRIVKRVDEVISHELAHQWFGDLVTMKWWDDLWLNESFATFMSYKALESKHPDWEIMGEMVTDETGGAMVGDSLRNTHPIHVEVKNPDEISQIFDEISYGKGSSILRMIEAYVGEENFRDGVRNYLKEHSFGNAVGENLWTSIEKVSKKPVSKIMDAWITKPGYPVIEASRNGDKIRLHQTRFFLDSSPEDSTWPVPLTVVYSDRTESILMEHQKMDIPMADFKYINSNRSGFYRIKYDDELINLIRSNIPSMDKFSKWGLISDYNALFYSGKIKLDQLIGIMELFAEDREFILMDEITGIVLNLHSIMHNSRRIDEFAIKYLRRKLNDLGEKKEGETINTTVIRGTIQSALSLIDIEYARMASSRFRDFQKISPDERQSIAYSYAIIANDFSGLLQKLQELDVDEDKVKIIGAMGHLKGGENLSKVWDLIKEGKIKKQDSFRAIYAAATEEQNREYILEKIDEINDTLDKFFEGTGYTSRFQEFMIPYLGLHDEKRIREYIARTEKPSWITGTRKGLEYLNIYIKMNNE